MLRPASKCPPAAACACRWQRALCTPSGTGCGCEGGTVGVPSPQVPSAWRTVMQDAATMQILLEFYKNTEPPRSSSAMQVRPGSLSAQNQHLNGSRRSLRPGSLSAQNQHLNGNRRTPEAPPDLNPTSTKASSPLFTQPALAMIHPFTRFLIFV